MKILIGVAITLVMLIALFLVYIHSGWYNVSAMHEENSFMKWVFKTTKNNSVEARIQDISVPNLNDPSLIKEGFEHYDGMCANCHGAPGLEESELSKGLNPPAPYLPKVAKYIEPAEMFWVTKNGIKMTGMPAWGKTHSNEKIWAIVAFMRKLPTLTKEQYQSYKNAIKNESDITNEDTH